MRKYKTNKIIRPHNTKSYKCYSELGHIKLMMQSMIIQINVQSVKPGNALNKYENGSKQTK